MSKPKLSPVTILFILLVVAALLGPQMSKQADGQQGKIVFESNLGAYFADRDHRFRRIVIGRFGRS